MNALASLTSWRLQPQLSTLRGGTTVVKRRSVITAKRLQWGARQLAHEIPARGARAMLDVTSEGISGLCALSCARRTALGSVEF